MNIVKSAVDGREWTAEEFSRQDAERRKHLRKTLVCLACNRPAEHRAGGKRKPFFAARHSSECLIKHPSWSAFRYLV